MSYRLSVISFKDCPFAVVCKKSSSYQKSSRFCPTFYYNFILSYLLFRCMIHFELIFMTGIWSLDFFFMWMCSCSSTICWIDCLCSIVLPLLLFQWSVNYIFVDPFLGFVLLIYMSVLSLISHCLDYSSF